MEDGAKRLTPGKVGYMRHGYERQYETDAIADYAQIVKIIAHDHPEDAALQSYCTKVKLTAIMILAGEIRDTGQSNILQDRMSDCRDCEQQEGTRPCMADGLRGRCKYNSPEYRIKAIVKHFGENAFDPIKPYLPNAKEAEGT